LLSHLGAAKPRGNTHWSCACRRDLACAAYANLGSCSKLRVARAELPTEPVIAKFDKYHLVMSARRARDIHRPPDNQAARLILPAARHHPLMRGNVVSYQASHHRDHVFGNTDRVAMDHRCHSRCRRSTSASAAPVLPARVGATRPRSPVSTRRRCRALLHPAWTIRYIS
jgi:hypothetical protein